MTKGSTESAAESAVADQLLQLEDQHGRRRGENAMGDRDRHPVVLAGAGEHDRIIADRGQPEPAVYPSGTCETYRGEQCIRPEQQHGRPLRPRYGNAPAMVGVHSMDTLGGIWI